MLFYRGEFYEPSYGKMNAGSFKSEIDKLNSLVEDGWELSSTYIILETKFPNFGNKGYHIGIKTNTRTKTIVCVFKRLKEIKFSSFYISKLK